MDDKEVGELWQRYDQVTGLIKDESDEFVVALRAILALIDKLVEERAKLIHCENGGKDEFDVSDLDTARFEFRLPEK